MSNVTIHKAELAGYSSVVGQPIMLLNAQGAVIGQLSLIGAQGDYKAMVAEIADRLNAPNRHSYRVGVEVGRGSAAREIKEATDEAHACGAERAVWKERAEAAEAKVKTAREDALREAAADCKSHADWCRRKRKGIPAYDETAARCLEATRRNILAMIKEPK